MYDRGKSEGKAKVWFIKFDVYMEVTRMEKHKFVKDGNRVKCGKCNRYYFEDTKDRTHVDVPEHSPFCRAGVKDGRCRVCFPKQYN